MTILHRLGRRWRWWQLYLLLLFASQLVQLFWPRLPQPDAGYSIVKLAPQTAAGPVDGEPIHLCYRMVGAGDTVILLHGSPGAIADYRYLEPALAARSCVVIPDLPGFGRSSRWLPDYSIKAHARYVLALMDELQIERAAVVGFSMGSGVALHLAELASQRVSSLTLCGGIGVQEGEGSGDYAFEHLKYAVAYAGLVVLPEGLPHFGLLGTRSFRHTFARNFWDTDQRPLREILEQLHQPLLILHGRRDPLVPAWTAEEHHRLVRHSELVMFDDSHFMLLSPQGSAQLAAEMVPFLERHRDPAAAPQPRTVDHSQGKHRPATLPADLHVDRALGPWLIMATLMLATLVSEDLTCVTAGLLVHFGQLDLFLAVLGCFLGIYFGDLGLWFLGRLAGRGLLHWQWLSRRLPRQRLDELAAWLNCRGWIAILASRFLPGTRLPLYVTAGVVGQRFGSFALWTALAALLWTPLVVIGTALLGDAFVAPFTFLVGPGWLAVLIGALGLLLTIRVVTLACSAVGRGKLTAKVSRVWRWEFWPSWFFYLPVIPWMGYLSLRYRGFITWTAANPGIPQGGVVGESKYEILSHLPVEFVVPSILVSPGELACRLECVQQALDSGRLSWPLILKPDASQRGAGVKRLRDLVDAEKYLRNQPAAVVAQTFHPGPFEVGIFYYRIPGEATGHIFSITDKVFSVLVGDGKTTFEELIWRHPRYRMQAGRFLARHDRDRNRVLADGERLPLALAGNHCQGTMFRDGAHLITPALEQAIDGIAQHFPEFFIGRFDVRYADPVEFQAGRDLAIVELNGVTSESTNIYDPSWTLWAAYRTLYRQWDLLYRIGHANRLRGHEPTPLLALIRLVRAYYRQVRVDPMAD